MGVILEECGSEGALEIQGECPKFQCERGAVLCCCQQMLYDEPDFIGVESLLEIACKAHGVMLHMILTSEMLLTNQHSL
jgi:hypothetical protein